MKIVFTKTTKIVPHKYTQRRYAMLMRVNGKIRRGFSIPIGRKVWR